MSVSFLNFYKFNNQLTTHCIHKKSSIDFNMYCLANLIKIMINEEYFLQKHAKNENKM